MKVCFKQIYCNNPNPQPLSNFYKHSGMADGRLNKCILCTRGDSTARLKELIRTDKKWFMREVERQRTKSIRHYYIKKDTAGYKKRADANRQRYRERNPAKVAAHKAVQSAVRTGIIEVKTVCERCGASNVRIEKHHADYSKPLSVEFLCCKCHRLEHRKWK